MKTLMSILLILIVTNIAYSQKSNTEVGIRLFNLINYQESNGWGGSSIRTGIKSSFKYEQEVSMGLYGNYYKVQNIKTTGLYIPGIFIRQRVFKNIWIRGVAEIFSQHTVSSQSFSNQMGTSGQYYTKYDIARKGIHIDYAIQYQWLNKRSIKVYSGLESQFIWQKITDNSIGYTSGCFGGEAFSPSVKRYFYPITFPNITNSISFRVYKNYQLGYENAVTINGPLMFHRFSLSKKI